MLKLKSVFSAVFRMTSDTAHRFSDRLYEEGLAYKNACTQHFVCSHGSVKSVDIVE